jgi:hypothetical protein
MESGAVVYQRKEKVTVVSFDGKDYMVRDNDTGRHYMIDAHYFRSHYEAEASGLPVHTEVWDKLDALAFELYQVKRANTKLRKANKEKRKHKEKKRKEQPEAKHYRNGQKRGRHGRNG